MLCNPPHSHCGFLKFVSILRPSASLCKSMFYDANMSCCWLDDSFSTLPFAPSSALLWLHLPMFFSTLLACRLEHPMLPLCGTCQQAYLVKTKVR